MRRRTFKVSDLSGERIVIRGDEAHHALRVLRLSAGDEIELIDGRGGRAKARIERVGERELTAAVLGRADEQTGGGLEIAAAIPKGERSDWMVEKCAELGVARLIPLVCERSGVRPGESRLARWRRKADEAAKQSGQSRCMTISEPMSPVDALDQFGDAALKWYGAPGAATSLARAITARARAAGDRTNAGDVSTVALVLIGPEGGFSPAEIELFEKSGVAAASLGPTILRVETAAIAAAAMWSGMKGE